MNIPTLQRLCRMVPALVLVLALLTGCSLLDRDYGVVEPHANRYWEDSASDILRAESYQDLVNTLMLLVEQHGESGMLRLYLTDVGYIAALDMMRQAITEVREETAIGSYSLERMDFNMEELRNSYYQVELHPVYRRTAEDLAAIQETASSSAIYDMLLRAYEEGEERLTVRYAYLAEEQEVLLQNIRQLQAELEGFVLPGEGGESGQEEIPTEEPSGEEEPTVPEVSGEAGETGEEEPVPPDYVLWEVNLYPPNGESSIVEIFLKPEAPESPAA